MGKKNKNISALILVGTSAVLPFLQNASTVMADGKINESFSFLRFFSFIKDMFSRIFSDSNEEPPKKKKVRSYSMNVPPLEDYVCSIYDGGEVDKFAKEFLKNEIKGKNKVSDEDVERKFEQMSEEEKIKYRVQGIMQVNHKRLVSSKETCLKLEKEARENRVRQLETEKKSLQERVDSLKNEIVQLEMKLGNKIEGSLNKEIKIQENSLNNKLEATNNAVTEVEKGNVKSSPDSNINKEGLSIDKDSNNSLILSKDSILQPNANEAKSDVSASKEKSLDEMKKNLDNANKELDAIEKFLPRIEEEIVYTNGRVKEIGEYFDHLNMKDTQENKKSDDSKEVMSANSEENKDLGVQKKVELVDPQLLMKFEDTLYKAFDVSKAKGNNRAVLSAENYFKEIVGFSENYFRSHPEKIKQCFQKDSDGNVIVRNLLNGREFCAGKFEQLSLGSVKNCEINNNMKKQGKVSVIGINRKFDEANPDLQRMVNVSYLQAKEENRKSLFVVASNYNALETLSANNSAEKKHITRYFYDRTQGPASVLPGIASTLQRHLGLYKDKYPEEVSKWGQTDGGERQVNLLEGLGIKTKNGYIFDDIKKILEVTEKLEKSGEEKKELKDKFKIGYHSNVQICADNIDFYKRRASFFYNRDQKIDQAFVAAVSLTDNDIKNIVFESLSKEEKDKLNELEKSDQDKYDKKYNKYFDHCKGVLERFAQQVAELNFETILRAAVAKGITKIYFPLLGCGAFGNEYSWVINAIEKNKDFIKKSGLEIIINIASNGVEESGLYKDTANLVKDCNGEFKIYDEDRNGKIIDLGNNILSSVENSMKKQKNMGIFGSFFDYIFG